MAEPTNERITIDPDTLDNISPRDQGVALLALLYMDAKSITLEDVNSEYPFIQEKR